MSPLETLYLALFVWKREIDHLKYGEKIWFSDTVRCGKGFRVFIYSLWCTRRIVEFFLIKHIFLKKMNSKKFQNGSLIIMKNEHKK